jgi:hypothetical protein
MYEIYQSMLAEFLYTKMALFAIKATKIDCII